MGGARGQGCGGGVSARRLHGACCHEQAPARQALEQRPHLVLVHGVDVESELLRAVQRRLRRLTRRRRSCAKAVAHRVAPKRVAPDCRHVCVHCAQQRSVRSACPRGCHRLPGAAESNTLPAVSRGVTGRDRSACFLRAGGQTYGGARRARTASGYLRGGRGAGRASGHARMGPAAMGHAARTVSGRISRITYTHHKPCGSASA